MKTEEVRTLKVTMDQGRLHSAIVGAMRRKRIPRNLRGYDILRGIVYGMIDHPEYDFQRAVERAVEVCSLPGCPESIEEGILEAFDCVEPVMREVDFVNPETQEPYSEEEVVKKVADGLMCDVRKGYCYGLTVEFLEKKGFKIGMLSVELLKDMIFKKLVADDSTQECMLDYAYRKCVLPNPNDQIRADEVAKYVVNNMQEIVPEGMTPYTFACKCVDEIYEEKNQ